MVQRPRGFPPSQKPPFVCQYLSIDSHLTGRNGYTDDVAGLANERPAGKKLSEDIATTCTLLHNDGYDVVNILPVISGRVSQATVEVEDRRKWPSYSGWGAIDTETVVENGVGYSVTDGVIIVFRLKN